MSLGERVPKLRFPGFEGEWEERTLEKCCRCFDNKRKPISAELREKGEVPYYGANGIQDYVKDFIFNGKFLLLAEDGGHFDEYSKKPIAQYITGKSWVNNHAHVLSGKDNCLTEYIYFSLVHKDIRKYINGTSRAKLNQEDMWDIKIHVPQVKLQEKISTFLFLIEERIAAQRKLVELLKKHKRGLIKRLFQPNEHTKWKSVRLGDVGTFHKGAPLSKADISEDGKPFILYGELYTTYGEIIKDVVRRTTAEIDIPYLSRCGDVIIPTSGETAEEIATASCVMSDGVVLGGDLNIYRSEHIDGRFLAYAVRFIISRDISRIAQGVSVVHISATELKRISVSIPSKDEQIRIVSIIENYDNRILHSQEILMKMETTKDGLLQQLFV